MALSIKMKRVKSRKNCHRHQSDVKEDAWIQLLINYHKFVLSSWDFAIDVGVNWLKAQAHVWSPEYFRGLYRQTREKHRSYSE
ncbi:MAG TPA: hypothetical protein VGW09_07645 [Nitrososphaeraceae archaeon]|nr:hypothetical protein [Nitrososphaeraceae archaeon]